MSPKKKFEYYVEVEYEDGRRARFSIYRSGGVVLIENEHGYEVVQHQSSESVDREIWLAFKAKVIRKIFPWEKQ